MPLPSARWCTPPLPAARHSPAAASAECRAKAAEAKSQWLCTFPFTLHRHWLKQQEDLSISLTEQAGTFRDKLPQQVLSPALELPDIRRLRQHGRGFQEDFGSTGSLAHELLQVGRRHVLLLLLRQLVPQARFLNLPFDGVIVEEAAHTDHRLADIRALRFRWQQGKERADQLTRTRAPLPRLLLPVPGKLPRASAKNAARPRPHGITEWDGITPWDGRPGIAEHKARDRPGNCSFGGVGCSETLRQCSLPYSLAPKKWARGVCVQYSHRLS